MEISKSRELLDRELAYLNDNDIDRLLAYARDLRQDHEDKEALLRATSAVFARDWFSQEEDAAWAHL